MYNKDILIDEIKNNKLPITKSEIEELSLSYSYVGKSDKDILQALVDLDLLLKKFFFRMMKKSKEKGLDFFKLCHKKMKKAYEVWSMACSNEYERNKLGTIYENSMFMHKEFYKQKTFASKEPLITVLMPTFNSENYIGETLWSVFEQTCPDFELLIMNEAGSSPETTEVISFFEDDRIKVVQNKTRLGLAESLNEGIKIARGKYIARIDADDLATEDRFELQADFLENNKEYGLCGSRQHHFGVDTDFVHEVAEEHDDIKAALIYGCEICHSTIMIRREYFLKNNLFYDNTKKAEDYELWTRAVHKFKFHNIKKVLGEYRVGAENITKNKFNALSAESAVIAANNLSKYLNVNVSKNHLEYLTGWENRFEEVEEKERKVALEEEEAILREMVKNNLIYKNYKDSSLLIAINRRWRWILGKYSYGHDLDEVLNVDDLFKKYPFSEIRCDEENCTDKSFSLKQCLKGVLKFFYTPFRHGISYKMRQQLWDLDGHLKDSKDEILNNVTDSKYDILNHVKDSETRLKQQTYLMLEKNGNELYDQLERSIEKLEGQVESIKAMVELQNASLKEMIDSRIYKAETNLGQTFDSRIYKAET
ncbi:MAG: glycosyltransferase family 2 protein, partial [Lachnoanaerobaculum saburreum]